MVRQARWALILLGILSLAVLSVLLKPLSPGRNDEPFPHPSVYNSKPSGLRAWYLAGQKAGLPISLWERPFQDLSELPAPITMLMVQPDAAGPAGTAYDPESTRALRQWIARGNTLILLDNFQRKASKVWIDPQGIQAKWSAKPVNHKAEATPLFIQPALRSFIQKPVYSSEFQAFVLPSQPRKPIEVLLRNSQQEPVLIRTPFGKGSLILGFGTDLMQNRYLHQTDWDNFQFAANLLTLKKQPILINEYIHGYSQTRDIFAYFREKTPVGHIFMQLIFVFLLLLWLSFTRWTPILAPVDSTVRQNGGLRQLIDSLAGVYYRRREATPAIQPQLEQIAAVLKRKYQVDLQDTPRLKSLIESLGAPYSGKDAASVLHTLQKAQTVTDTEAELSHPELHRLSRDLTDLQEHLQHAKR